MKTNLHNIEVDYTTHKTLRSGTNYAITVTISFSLYETTVFQLATLKLIDIAVTTAVACRRLVVGREIGHLLSLYQPPLALALACHHEELVRCSRSK